MSIATSPNRAYLATCLRHSAQIQPYGWTSETLEPLGEIDDCEVIKWRKYQKSKNVC